MTEDGTATDTGARQGDQPTAVLTELMARTVYQDDRNKMGVTLVTSGAIIAGDIVSLKRWFEEVASRMEQDAPDGMMSLGRILSQAHAEMVSRDDSDVRELWPSELQTAYLINVDVQPIGSGFRPVAAGSPWAVDLSQVAAWTFGRPDWE